MHQVFDMWILTCSQWNEYKLFPLSFPGQQTLEHTPHTVSNYTWTLWNTQIKHIFVLNKL